MVIYKVIYIYCCSQSYIYCWKYKNSPIMNFTSWRREAHLFIWFRKPSYQQTFYLHIYTHKGYTCICIICVLIRFCNILYQDLISLSPSLDKRFLCDIICSSPNLKIEKYVHFHEQAPTSQQIHDSQEAKFHITT